MKMQALLIRTILQPMGSWMSRFSQKTRDRVFLVCLLGIFAQFLLHSAGISPDRYLVSYAIGCVLLGGMIWTTLPEKLVPVRFSPVLSVFFFGTGLLLAQAGVRLNEDYLSSALLVLIAYPIVFLSWGQQDTGRPFRLLRMAVRISYVPVLTVSIVWFPFGIKPYYQSFFSNPNGMAIYLTLVICCGLTDLYAAGRFSARMVWQLFLLGTATAMLFLSTARASALACLVSGLCLTGLTAWGKGQHWRQFLLTRVLPVLAAMLVLLPVTYGLLQLTAENAEYGFRNAAEYSERKLAAEGKTLDGMSSGRVSIWMVYGQHLRLLGSGEEERFYIPSLDRYYSTSHNTPIEYAFRGGLLCAVCYLGFNLTAGLAAVGWGIRRKEQVDALFPLTIALTYGAISMLESQCTPFLSMIELYYFLSQAPLLVRAAKPLECKTEKEISHAADFVDHSRLSC